MRVYFDGKANEIAIALSDCVREASKSQPSSAAKRDAAIKAPSLDIPKKTNARDALQPAIMIQGLDAVASIAPGAVATPPTAS